MTDSKDTSTHALPTRLHTFTRRGYTAAVPQGMGRENPDKQRKAAPDSYAAFLRPDIGGLTTCRQHAYGREGDGYNTRKGKKSACLFAGSQPPGRLAGLRVRTHPTRRFLKRLKQERSMSQLALTGAIAPAITVIDGSPTTLSTDVARHFGKQHLHVMERIRALLPDLPEQHQSDFRLVEYTDAKGEKRPAYRLTRDGFVVLAMGFTGKKALQFKLAYIDAFNRMEAELAQRNALSVDDAVRLDHAFQLASQAAAQVQRAVFNAVMADGPDWKSNRYLLSFDFAANGLQAKANAIERNAYVLPMHRFADAIGSTTRPDLECLSQIASTCLQRINFALKQAKQEEA